ncbi:MAG: AAA family ATPase [Hyphomicrobium sp.]|nr:AAA family ATPase [Hyphomicrobium sp.]
MRPVILKMQAFGPYAGCTTVDFRRVLDSGLFGIYGATGSGKSSIFSAMTFALFGESAKGEQLARTLRSDHADPDLLTQVELIFEIGERRYRVVRRPDQKRPKKRGGGETDEDHAAWLFDLSGLDVDLVGDETPGKAIAERKVGDVNSEIKRLLGYEAAQFRQIVLLPQGQFETFLNAKTENRLGILRELFDVSTYERLTERLKSRAKCVRDEISHRRAVNAGRLASEAFDSLDRLGDGIAAVQKQCEDLTAAKTDAEAALKQADTAYQAAAQTDKHFAEHAEAERGLNEVAADAETNDAYKTRLNSARGAAKIMPLADKLAEAERSLRMAKQTLDGAAEERQHAEGAVSTANGRLDALDAQAATIEAKKDRLRQLRGFAGVLATSETLRRAHDEAAQVAADCEGTFSEAEKKKVECEKQHARRVAEREAVQTATINRSNLKLKEQETEARRKAARAFETAQAALAQSRKQHEKTRSEHDEAARALEAQRSQFAKVEAALLEDHALHLAGHLQDGKPCPVCGSPDHPAPASGTAAEVDLAARYRQAKQAFDQAAASAEKTSADLNRAEADVNQREEAIRDLDAPDAPAAEIAARVSAIQRDIAALGPERDIAECDAQVAQAEAQVTAALAALEAARKDRDSAHLKANSAKTELESALAAIPAELRAEDRIAAAIAVTEQEVTRFARDREQAVQVSQGAQSALASANTTLQLAESGLKTAEQSREAAKARFDAGLNSSGLTQETLDAARGDIDRMEEIERRIESFSQKLAAAKDRFERAKMAIAETDRPDIAALKAARDEAQAMREEALKNSLDATARLGQLQKLHRELRDEAAALDRREAETGPLRDLAQAFSGDNDERTTLETFAIATMFEHVLAAANLRLEPMTRGRFRLSRGSDSHGRARRGLDIQVEDSFTGRPRPTSTLSGGETFIAALALALGLSDVVESTRGNVRLDAIFIDEGFGSLDSADDAGTLDQVLQSLTELVGKRRAVGLISHVPLVQQTVPNGFWVTSSPSGSRIEERN